MDFSIVIILIIVSALAAILAIWLFKKNKTDDSEQAASDYAEGLNLLLLGKQEQALRKFRETVTKNSKNIDAYLKIGDILRDLGQTERAINVHKYLTVRTGLTTKQQHDILRSLAEDYLAAQEYDKALDVLNRILDENKNLPWAHEMKLRVFEQKQEWNNAFQTCKELKKLDRKFSNGRLALYKVQEGLQLIDEDNEKEAQNRFREAIKIAPESPPAYIYLADSYKRENRKRDALKVLKQFVEKQPSKSFLAFERLKELLYEGGVYGEIENLYLDIIQSQPDNHMARLALAENYEKKGEIRKAIITCQEVLELEPLNRAAKKNLVRLHHKAGNDEKALETALELIDTSANQKENFKCHSCGYESDELFLRCPKCSEWETVLYN